MSLIYEPKGRAKEYAALALNVYRGCDHGCKYCYAVKVTHSNPGRFHTPTVRSLDFLKELRKEAEKRQAQGMTGQVMLCFTCDAYQNYDVNAKETREAILILHKYGFSVCVLTKGGKRAERDLSLFTPQDAFAVTMTFMSSDKSKEWEPRAAEPVDRIRALEVFHEAGIPTWVSLEPVIAPSDALAFINYLSPIADGFKVGQLNYHPLAKTIDWAAFGHAAIELLEKRGYRNDPKVPKWYYIKEDLRAYL